MHNAINLAINFAITTIFTHNKLNDAGSLQESKHLKNL